VLLDGFSLNKREGITSVGRARELCEGFLEKQGSDHDTQVFDGKIAERLSSERVTSANEIGGKCSLSPILPVKFLKRSVPFLLAQ
jgi:hypothetical protein